MLDAICSVVNGYTVNILVFVRLEMFFPVGCMLLIISKTATVNVICLQFHSIGTAVDEITDG